MGKVGGFVEGGDGGEGVLTYTFAKTLLWFMLSRNGTILKGELHKTELIATFVILYAH